VKPRNREVNIFNMSVLDLLTGALGAFCFLTLALFPSYFKTQKSSAPDQRQQLGKTKNGIPPFSLVEIFTQDDKGFRCGALRFESLQAPKGNKSFRQLRSQVSRSRATRVTFIFSCSIPVPTTLR